MGVAKPKRRPSKLIKLVSVLGTGSFYVSPLSSKRKVKLSFRKFDPKALVHCAFEGPSAARCY
ncbi:MAG: hypothetical protein ACKER6_00110 [Candidatus Hodgkinia cicadicola]